MQQVGDRQKMLNQYGLLLSDPRLRTQVTRAKDISDLEGRVIAHIQDDATGAPHMILEGTDARVHFIRHTSTMEQMRREGRLAPNSFVAFRQTEEGDRPLKIDDLGDADQYLASAQMRNSARRLVQRGIIGADAEYGGWLGKYYQRLAEANAPEKTHPVSRGAHAQTPDKPRGR
jgi:hypothetical protein